jgi:DNA-binding LytR/AlgR family response regulator
VVEVIDSVEAAVKWLNIFPAPELVFMDIQLADGLSFDIFGKTDLTAPVVFTTAFDHYTLKAFKVNSVDYLLKPIDPAELVSALDKYRRIRQQQSSYDRSGIEKMLQSLAAPKEYRDRFLVKSGQHFTHVPVSEIAYFFSEDGIAFVQCSDGKKHIIEYTLDQLEGMLDPKLFFRINRQAIVKPDAIKRISTWFNSRLKLELAPSHDTNNVVSRERAQEFKRWIGQ